MKRNCFCMSQSLAALIGIFCFGNSCTTGMSTYVGCFFKSTTSFQWMLVLVFSKFRHFDPSDFVPHLNLATIHVNCLLLQTQGFNELPYIKHLISNASNCCFILTKCIHHNRLILVDWVYVFTFFTSASIFAKSRSLSRSEWPTSGNLCSVDKNRLVNTRYCQKHISPKFLFYPTQESLHATSLAEGPPALDTSRNARRAEHTSFIPLSLILCPNLKEAGFSILCNEMHACIVEPQVEHNAST